MLLSNIFYFYFSFLSLQVVAVYHYQVVGLNLQAVLLPLQLVKGAGVLMRYYFLVVIREGYGWDG